MAARNWRKGLLALGLSFVAPTALAQEPSPPPPPPPAPAEAAPAEPSLTPSQLHLESDTTPPPTTTIPEAPAEAPPPLPHHKGVVVEGGVGAMGFLGNFRHVAPTAPWFHLTAGYEIWNWLMLFAEGELAFTDTSEAEGPSQVYGFPIFGFGGGARVTIHATRRFAIFVQGEIDGMKADVPAGALKTLGYPNAESVGVSFGGRLGIVWYQVDRHMALGISGGVRDATGFAKTFGSDVGLMADANATIGYTF
jgi:hypothetical protein